MSTWQTEDLQRSGYTLLTVYRDDEVIGSLTFPEGDSQIGKWKSWVTSLNNQNGTAEMTGTQTVGAEKK